MKNKKRLKMFMFTLLIVFAFIPLISLASDCVEAYRANYCLWISSFGLTMGTFMINLFYVLFALLFWFISPIGILFLLGIKLFFSWKASVIRRNFALALQILSFLSWSSLMIILLIVYLDSVSYRVLGIGGELLNLAIKSGFAFLFFMIILVFAERKIISRQKNYNDDKKKRDEEESKKRNKNPKKKNKKEKSIKIAGIEFGGAKNKIKEEIKEIIDNEIDKI
ncbi:MAG: hypothetical protein P1P85_04620 [Patescibacteria group bacterium]|nr:hypothetical protein [Patescibacteria group bacterium]